VTANEFDLVDSSGAVRGKLSMKYASTPALTLYDIQGRETVSLSSGMAEELMLTSGNNQISLRAGYGGTFLWFNDQGPSGKARFTVQISGDRTVFSLSGQDYKTAFDAYIEKQIVFTSLTDHNDKQRAAFGIDKSGDPYLSLSDDNEHTRSELRSNLSLLDEWGNLRTVIGSMVLKNTKTGSTEQLSPSSVTLFGENGRLLWQAPR
jgi:hypothetical protein